jgi:hypothetical protein
VEVVDAADDCATRLDIVLEASIGATLAPVPYTAASSVVE